jgi:hypothetical protein
MNERIKALAVEADFALYEDGNFRSDPGQWINQELEKFAKLIIQECARVAVATPCPITDEISLQSQGHTWDMACVESGRAIKQNFRS